METTEKNKLIAEFMEFQKTNIGWYDSEDSLSLSYTNDNTFDTLLFDKSWDWLMPVVEKINHLTDDNDKFLYNFTITGSWCEVAYTNGEGDFINNEHGGTFVEMIYLTVVEFIKQYNDGK